MKANIPALNVRALQKKIQAVGFERTTSVQEKLLEKVAKSFPNGRFWIKADACDVKRGLRESVKCQSSGDCDLGDGALQKSYKEYLERREYVTKIGLSYRRRHLSEDLGKLLLDLEAVQTFL